MEAVLPLEGHPPFPPGKGEEAPFPEAWKKDLPSRKEACLRKKSRAFLSKKELLPVPKEEEIEEEGEGLLLDVHIPRQGKGEEAPSFPDVLEGDFPKGSLPFPKEEGEGPLPLPDPLPFLEKDVRSDRCHGAILSPAL